jgi:hypothetical protein
MDYLLNFITSLNFRVKLFRCQAKLLHICILKIIDKNLLLTEFRDEFFLKIFIQVL